MIRVVFNAFGQLFDPCLTCNKPENHSAVTHPLRRPSAVEHAFTRHHPRPLLTPVWFGQFLQHFVSVSNGSIFQID